MGNKLYSKTDTSRLVGKPTPTDQQEYYRTPFRRDYARLIHSAAFRRLQGKTQLFPGHESDFFRNRLTHSLEVAQIAKSIAIKFNATVPYFKKNNIDTDLIETAALAHDLGHPPFGHNGEQALNECMREFGGFEGNAQTLRILSKLEKRETRNPVGKNIYDSVLHEKDNRVGLNLTFRTLASVLKYDNKIPHNLGGLPGQHVKVTKGYYDTEADLVTLIKKNVGAEPDIPFKTIECSIMDIADDIAYSTYDLEDSFKAGFLTPMVMWTVEDSIIGSVVDTVKLRLNKYYGDYSAKRRDFSAADLSLILYETFENIFLIDEDDKETMRQLVEEDEWPVISAIATHRAATASGFTSSSGYYRTKFTSELVGTLIRGVKVKEVGENPKFWQANLNIDLFKKMEVLKNFAYYSLIMSPRLKVAEHRGKDIVHSIFKAIRSDDGHLLMPEDSQRIYDGVKDPGEKSRAICDFIAGMTDRYAVKFYGRLFGTNPESIYAPL